MTGAQLSMSVTNSETMFPEVVALNLPELLLSMHSESITVQFSNRFLESFTWLLALQAGMGDLFAEVRCFISCRFRGEYDLSTMYGRICTPLTELHHGLRRRSVS